MRAIDTLRHGARRWIPPEIRRPLRVPLTYGERLVWWARVVREVRGTSPADRARLAVSALAAPLTALRDLTHWRDPDLLFDAGVTVEDGLRFSVRAHTDDLFHVLPSREKAVLETIRRLLTSGAVFVDAGANIGFYTVLAAHRVGPRGRVYAIEMIPETARRLREHVRVNQLDNVRVVEAALAPVAGQTVTAFAPERQFGQARLRPSGSAEEGTVSILTETLDRVLRDEPRVHLMKMDIEGAEADALRGATSALSRVDAIVFEDLAATAGEASVTASMLEAAGFEVRPIGGKDFLATRA